MKEEKHFARLYLGGDIAGEPEFVKKHHLHGTRTEVPFYRLRPD
ncbi:MAG: hypothetical protein V3T00_05465 [bacterium]